VACTEAGMRPPLRPILNELPPAASSSHQGLTLVHLRAQLEQLQNTLMSSVGVYGGQKSSS